MLLPWGDGGFSTEQQESTQARSVCFTCWQHVDVSLREQGSGQALFFVTLAGLKHDLVEGFFPTLSSASHLRRKFRFSPRLPTGDDLPAAPVAKQESVEPLDDDDFLKLSRLLGDERTRRSQQVSRPRARRARQMQPRAANFGAYCSRAERW